MKVIVKQMYPILEDYFSLGEEITITTHLYEEDTIIVHPTYVTTCDRAYRISYSTYKLQERIDKGEVVMLDPPTIAKKGSYKDASFTNAKGNTYEIDRLVGLLGYNRGSLSHLFEKC